MLVLGVGIWQDRSGRSSRTSLLVRWPNRSLPLFALSLTSGARMIGTTSTLTSLLLHLLSASLRRDYTWYVAFPGWMFECTVLFIFDSAFIIVGAGNGLQLRIWGKAEQRPLVEGCTLQVIEIHTTYILARKKWESLPLKSKSEVGCTDQASVCSAGLSFNATS